MDYYSQAVADTDSPQSPQASRQMRYGLLVLLAFVLCAIAGLWLWWHHIQTPPAGFPVREPVVIEEGMSVSDIAAAFYKAGVVRSEWALYALLVLRYDPRDIKASTYVFAEPLRLQAVAEKLSEGDYTSDLVRLTFTEGIRARDMAAIVGETLPELDEDLLVSLLEPFEGQLFPETYYIPPRFTEVDIANLLRDTFAAVYAELATQKTSVLEREDVVILASILEREANSTTSMGMVSGILHNRLAIDMPLQADATMEYVLDGPLSSLTPADLKIDSPYNTYLNRGLPPTAIGNPGRTALAAALNPTPSSFLFYITGNDGVFYYAEDFDEHRLNIARYLR